MATTKTDAFVAGARHLEIDFLLAFKQDFAVIERREEEQAL